MTASTLEKELKTANGGAVVITMSELARLLNYADPWALKKKLTKDDPDSRVPVLRPVFGKKYAIKEVAIRVTELGENDD